MPFPSHDPYWVEVATFLDNHITDEDDIFAPNEFEYRFVHSFPYSTATLLPASGFQWFVIHKGLAEKLPLPFLMAALKHGRPVYANPVFAILSSHSQLPAAENNEDLLSFNRQIRDLAQRARSGGASNTPSEVQSVQFSPPQTTDLKISIITICRNAAATIEKTLQQVADQTYPNIEYIVVDGGSEDDTLAICDRYHSAITKRVSEPDDGIYNAMNKGIGLATGDFLYFANADDYLFDVQVIQDAVSFIQEHPESDVVYGDHEARFPDTLLASSIHSPISPEEMLDAIICFKGNCLMQPASLFRRTVFEKVGGFSEEYGIASDYKWFLDALQMPSVIFTQIPRTIVSYAHGGRSGNLRELFEEIFDIQQKDALCQTSDWALKRMQALQQDFLHKYEALQKFQRIANRRKDHLNQLKLRNENG